jgi:large subunit ribosomal protein L24e
MKRNPRKLKWTKAFRKAAGKEMVVDSTLQFAARRNVPIRYDRDLVTSTLKAMERISEIRSRRERVFYKNRMRGRRAQELIEAKKLVAEHSHLLPRLRGSEKKRLAMEAAGEIVPEEVGVLQKSKTVTVQREVRTQRLLVDGSVEETTELVKGAMDVDEDEDGSFGDGFEDVDDDDMETD